MRRTVEVDVIRRAIITIDSDSDDQMFDLVEQAIKCEDPNIQWKDPVVDCITTIAESDPVTADDHAYEERRDTALCGW